MQDKIIISCKNPSCNKKLRVPADRGELKITCPECRNIFNFNPINKTLEDLYKCGQTHLEQYSQTSSIENIKQAVGIFQELVNKCSPNLSELPKYLLALGNSLRTLHYTIRELDTLENAIKVFEQATMLNSIDSTSYTLSLSLQGMTYHDRYYCYSGSLTDLEKSIKCCEKAVNKSQENSPNLPLLLYHLGRVFRSYFLHTGKSEYIIKSVNAHESSIEKSHPDSVDPLFLTDLGNALSEKYTVAGNLDDLIKSIDVCERAIALVPDNSFSMPWHLDCLGISLGYLYENTGRLDDLEQAINACEQAIDKIKNKGSDLDSRLLNLGSLLDLRYKRTGAIEDLNRILAVYEQALTITPLNGINYSLILSNLGNGLRNRFDRNGSLEDLNRVIDIHEESLKITPQDSSYLSGKLTNLSSGLLKRFELTKDLKDLQRSIALDEQALQITSQNSPELPGLLCNLGNGLTFRYKQLRDIKDLQLSIDLCKRAVSLTPEHSPNRCRYSNSLGYSFEVLYSQTGEFQDLQQGIDAYRKAAQIGIDLALEEGLMSARNWINWAFSRQAWTEVTQAYNYAYEAIERLLYIQIQRHEKESWLKETQSLAAKAAYAFAMSGKLKEAIIALERGVATLLSESLGRDRTELERLKLTGNEEIYYRYEQLVDKWHRLKKEHEPTKDAYQSLRNVNNDIQTIIKDIQQIDGYEHFFQPTSFDEILSASENTNLVYLFTTEFGGMAFVVEKTISCLELPIFTEKALEKIINGTKEDGKPNGYLNTYIRWKEFPNNNSLRREWFNAIEETTSWLWESAMGPLIEMLPDQASVTIIPVGILNLLPLHASWKADSGKSSGKLFALDILSISYSPNALSFLRAKKSVDKVNLDKLLAIDEPESVETNPLPFSKYEVQFVTSNFPHYKVLRKEKATKQAVLNELPNFTVLHLACHGYVDLTNPINSGLSMANEEFITLDDLLKQRIAGIRLATLSACETMIPGLNLPDEVINLPIGLLEAGAAGVVASLWSVSDLSTMMLMSYFYQLVKEKNLTLTEALRQSQQWVRDTNNLEKISFFKNAIEKVFSQSQFSVVKSSDFEEFYNLISSYEEDARDFSHPFHWAAFGYVGV